MMNPATLREQYVGVPVTVRLQLCSSNHYNRHAINRSLQPHVRDTSQARHVIREMPSSWQATSNSFITFRQLFSRDDPEEQVDAGNKSVCALRRTVCAVCVWCILRVKWLPRQRAFTTWGQRHHTLKANERCKIFSTYTYIAKQCVCVCVGGGVYCTGTKWGLWPNTKKVFRVR